MLSSTDKPYPMVYERTDGNERYVVVLNPSAKPATAQIAALGGKAEVVSAVGKASYKQGKKNDTVKAGETSATIFRIK